MSLQMELFPIELQDSFCDSNYKGREFAFRWEEQTHEIIYLISLILSLMCMHEENKI